MLWSLDCHLLGSDAFLRAGAVKGPSLQCVRVQGTVGCVGQQVLGCWTQVSRMIPKLCVPFSLPCLRDVDNGNAWKSYILLSPLLCHIALQSVVSLQATVALLPGRLWLSPQQGIPGAGIGSLKWCVLAKCFYEKHNSSLEFSQSCCTNAYL